MQLISALDAIPEDGVRFRYTDGPFTHEAILIRRGDGQVRAYKNECRHLAVPLDDREPTALWSRDGAHLECSSHGAQYRPDDGLCVVGPCKGSHLRSLPVEVRGGNVYLDTAQLGSFFDV